MSSQENSTAEQAHTQLCAHHTPNSTANQPDQSAHTTQGTCGGALRLIPPVAALGTSAVLQVIAVADLIGSALTTQFGGWAYLIGVLFGCSVAASAEGGAAYLLDLYDRHLLAGDSTWILKAAMCVYVCACGAALHWWAQYRGLPVILSWLLAAMSASALFLWSRGSRWKNREQMRARGQLDTALPRLSTPAKVLHPIRSLITVWLASWDQPGTTAQARARYAQWTADRAHRRAARRTARRAPIRCAPISDQPNAPISAQPHSTGARTDQVCTDQRPAISAQPSTQAISDQAHRTAEQHRRTAQADAPISAQHSEQTEQVRTTRTRQVITETEQVTEQVTLKATVEQLAAVLDEHFPNSIPGRVRALSVLRTPDRSCSDGRAKAAIDLLREQREGGDLR